MKPYLVLGMYHPPEWDLDRVGRELLAITDYHGLRPLKGIPHNLDDYCAWYSEKYMAGIRRRTAEGAQGEQWHYDGDTTPGAKIAQGVVLWASNTPAEIKFRNSDTIWQPKAREVVLINNLEVYHRRPPGAPHVRWTFRQRVELLHAW